MKLFHYQSYSSIFIKSLVFSILGILLGYLFFRTETSLISVFLTTLSLLWTANFLFERNSREIWEKITTPYTANKKLTLSLFCIFLGVMLGYGFFVFFTRTSVIKELLAMQLGVYREIKISIKDIDFGNFKTILTNNLTVLLIIFFISLIYRLGGVLLLIIWNASVWGSVFFYVTKISAGFMQMNPITYSILIILSILPHLVIEAIGYVLCGMSGFFISKGFLKYEFMSEKFLIVLKSSLLILAISAGLIILSAFLESNLTPKLISIFFSPAHIFQQALLSP